MSAERFTLDTNILIYSIDARDRAKQDLAAAVMASAVKLDCPIALQVIGEFRVAAHSKLKLGVKDAGNRARQLMTSFDTFAYSATAVRAALEEASAGRFSFWDAVLLASAAEAGCTLILSEDMQDGARFGSIAICSPFAAHGLSARARAALEI